MTREHPQNAAPVTYLGIDVGTSATKAVILASDGTVVARSRVPHPAARGAGPGRADPSAWRASITAAVRELAPHTADRRAVSAWTPTAPPPCCSTPPASRWSRASPGITPDWPNPPRSSSPHWIRPTGACSAIT